MSGDRIKWGPVLVRAAAIVRSYEDTSVTLRQLHYRLVAEQLVPNTLGYYKRLSDRTAKARRAGTFPDLTDRGRHIHRHAAWDSTQDALDAIAEQYRRGRTDGQPWSIYLGVEKAGIIEQLSAWFGDLGIPIAALSGYASQSYVDAVARDVSVAERPAVLLYAGDFDASGEDIDRDFIKRTDCWDKVIRVGLTADQVERHGLPVSIGKDGDSRRKTFEARHGSNMQVELDALPPQHLRALYAEAIDGFWDTSAYEAMLAEEAEERAQLQDLAERWAEL